MREHFTKRLTARLAVLLVAGATTFAAAPAMAEFRGGGVLHSFAGCVGFGYQDDDMEPVRARYRPSEVFGGTSRVSVFPPNGGAMHFSADATFDPSPTRHRGWGAGIYGSSWSWSPRPRIRVAARTPVLPRNSDFSTADVLDMQFRVINWGGEAGCRVTVQLTVHRH